MSELTEKKRPVTATLFASVLIALSVLACFHKLVIHPTDVLVGPQSGGENDLVNYYIPSRTFQRESLLNEGQVQFWNPWLSFGTAYIGNAQSSAFYPLNWVTILLDPTWSLSWLQLFHHWWAGLGVYCLCRCQKMSWGASIFGGVAMACAPFYIAQGAEGHYAQIAASSWMPWAFLSYSYFANSPTRTDMETGVANSLVRDSETFCETRSSRSHKTRMCSRRSQLAVAFCLAMSFLCSHPQETYYLVLALSCFALYEAIRYFLSGDRDSGLKILTGWTVVGGLTIGLVAIDLIPIYFNSRTTPRGLSAVSAELMGWSAYDLNHLWQLVAPFSIDRPETWQRGTPPFWEKVGYFGMIPLCFAVFGVIHCLRDRWVGRMSFLLVVTIFIALGTNAFLFPLMLKFLPGMTWFRLPSRLFFLSAFSLAYLAANGFQALSDLLPAVRPARKLILPLLFVVCGGLSLARFQMVGYEFETETLLNESLVWLTILALIPAVFMASSKKSVFQISAGLLFLLMIVESVWFSSQVTDTAKVVSISERNLEIEQALGEFQQENKITRLLTVQELISDQDAVTSHIPKSRGYDPASSVFFLTLMNGLSGVDDYTIDPTGFSQVRVNSTSQKFLNMSGISHVLQIRRKGYSEFPEGWESVLNGNISKRVQPRSLSKIPEYPIELVQNQNVFPEAFIVGKAVVPPKGAKLNEVVDRVDFRKSVIVDRDVLPEGKRARFQQASIISKSSDQLQIDCQLDAPGYLVVNHLWFPGWSATLDDKKLPVLRGNFSFRAVPLPAGKHTVQMKFEPPGFKVGMIVTCLTLMGSLYVLLAKSRTTGTSESESQS